jgi:hypothetical protein
MLNRDPNKDAEAFLLIVLLALAFFLGVETFKNPPEETPFVEIRP